MRNSFLSAAVCVTAAFSFAQGSIESIFGDLKGRHIGPALMSGRVTDVEGHPSNKQIVYIGTAGGGVWKSQDGGVIFNPIFDNYNQSIGVVTIDPSDPDNSVWVGTGECWTRNSVSVGDGIYRTTDGGKNWSHLGLEKTERISAIKVHPKDKNTVYVGALGALWGDSEDRGVYKTTDGGKSWTKILFVNSTTGCADLVMDPTDPNTLYASFWEFRRTAWSFNSGGLNSALYKSTDGGTTWKKIHTGFPSGKLGRIAVAVAPSNPSIVYAVIEAEKAEEKGLYRSEDGGKSWKYLNGDFGLTVRPFYFSRIVVDPKDPEIVVKAGLNGSISKDGGKTFKNLGAMHSDIHDIWFDVADSDKLFAATDGGLYRSLNGGVTLERIENLPLSQFYQVAFDNQEPYHVYGGLQDNGSWVGPSASPGGVESSDWRSVGWGDGFRVFPHPLYPTITYSEMQGAEGIWRFDSKENQIKQIKPFPVAGDPKLRFNWNTPIITSKHVSDRLYVGSQFVYRSDDRGDNWTRISPDLTTNDPKKMDQVASGGLSADNSGAENHCTIFTIAESPLNPNIVWAGTDDGNVQITKDGGKSWLNLTKNIKGLPGNTWCYHIEPSVFGEGIAYAVFDGHTKNDKQPYIFRTDDFGATWKSIGSGIPTFARCVQEDFVNPQFVYAGTEGGLYISIDGGTSWSKFDKNVPSVPILHLELHPTKHDLILATHGRGIIIVDNVSPLRELTNEVLAKPLHFFKSAPIEFDESSSFGGSSTETQFVGENPSTSAQIKYFLPKRHTFGKMLLDIYDEQGVWVTTIPPGKQKGINIVEWRFNSSAPKVASGATLAGEAAFAPRVKEGKYKVVITKGSEKYESWIELVYPKKSSISKEERQKQQQVTLQMFDMTENLAYLVYKLDTYIAFAKEVSSKQPKLKKSADELLTLFNGLKETLVITKGDNYVGSGEKQLREKLGDLYSTIGSYPGAPSYSQLESVKELNQQLEKANQKYSSLENKQLKGFLAAANKEGFQQPTLTLFQDFIKKN